MAMLYAHLYKKSKNDSRFAFSKFILSISDNIEGRDSKEEYGVKDKKAALKAAHDLNATPWNF